MDGPRLTKRNLEALNAMSQASDEKVHEPKVQPATSDEETKASEKTNETEETAETEETTETELPGLTDEEIAAEAAAFRRELEQKLQLVDTEIQDMLNQLRLSGTMPSPDVDDKKDA